MLATIAQIEEVLGGYEVDAAKITIPAELGRKRLQRWVTAAFYAEVTADEDHIERTALEMAEACLVAGYYLQTRIDMTGKGVVKMIQIEGETTRYLTPEEIAELRENLVQMALDLTCGLRVLAPEPGIMRCGSYDDLG